MDALLVLAIPLLMVAFLRWLTYRWFSWAIRPIERILSKVVRSLWRTLWTNPARAWGALNVLWVWLLVVAILITVGGFNSGSTEWFSILTVWLFVALGYWGLRALARWRLQPRRLPSRLRRE